VVVEEPYQIEIVNVSGMKIYPELNRERRIPRTGELWKHLENLVFERSGTAVTLGKLRGRSNVRTASALR